MRGENRVPAFPVEPNASDDIDIQSWNKNYLEFESCSKITSSDYYMNVIHGTKLVEKYKKNQVISPDRWLKIALSELGL